jgi:imidazole glycerol-phosphate synthase subunit HisH
VSAGTVIVAGAGANLTSLCCALERLGAPATVSADGAVIAAAARVILPGVGAPGPAMEQLAAAGLTQLLPRLRQPLLGICLGMQLLYAYSEEGATRCLGILPGRIARLKAAPGHPVPHMGWNTLEDLTRDPLLEGLEPGEHVYFVHGYAAAPGETTLACTKYGGELSAVVRSGNFCGTQFHPERSGDTGARLLANFLRL